jgi:hypothetical protein
VSPRPPPAPPLPPRKQVVNLSSVTHRYGWVGPLHSFLASWTPGSYYPSTKLANALFAFELQRRLGPRGVQVGCRPRRGLRGGRTLQQPPARRTREWSGAPTSPSPRCCLPACLPGPLANTVPWLRGFQLVEMALGVASLLFCGFPHPQMPAAATP